MRALAGNIDSRFQAFEGRFDALAIIANRDRNNDRRQLRDDFALGQPVNKPVPVHHCRQPIYSDDSEKEKDFLFGNNQPTRGGGRTWS